MKLLLLILSAQTKQWKLLKKSKVKVYQQEFVDYTKQRNKALSLAENDWYFFLTVMSGQLLILKKIIETINKKTLKMLIISTEYFL